MESFVVLYKDGVTSPPLHPIDASGWIECGWSAENVRGEPDPVPTPKKVTAKKVTTEES